MKINYLKMMTLSVVMLALIGSCEKEDDTNNQTDIIKKYSGSGSEGDLITFDINQTNNTYTIENETTGETENGSYTIISNNTLSGVYHIEKGSSNFYAVELDDKIIAANFPTGNPDNNISFGVSSSINNIGNTNNIAGDYVYIIMDNNGVMNNPKTKEWGILNIKGDNTWIKQSYATNIGNGSMTELSPENYSGTLPITNGDETGEWAVNGSNKERLDVTIDGLSATLSGYVYATSNEAAFLLDLGTGNGFLIGLKVNDNSTFNTIAGNYKFVNVWDNGYGAGNYSISNSGEVIWAHQGSDGESNGNFQLIQCSNVLKSIFYCDNVEFDDDYYEKLYCIVVGDIILELGFDNSNGDFTQYGIGAKIE